MKDKIVHCPRVLVLTSTFPRWENDPEPAFVFELSRRLAATFDVTVLAPRSPGSKPFEMMAGLRIIRFAYFFRRWENLAMYGGGIMSRLRSHPVNYLLVPFFLVGQLVALIRLLRGEKFDLIHAHWLIPQGMVAVLGLIFSRSRIPLICTSHGGDLFALRGKIFQRLKQWVISRSLALTVVSRAMQNMLIDMGVLLDRVHVISMGVDLKNRFIPDPEVRRSDDKILFVGRLVEGKGVEVLLRALPKVLREHTEVSLTIAGSGPEEKKLRELALRLRISDKIGFLGMVDQAGLPALYRRAALAVFPFVITRRGVQEGFGLVVVEAMGCNCPVVAGDLPGLHDSIINEESGLLVPDGSPERLAEAILRALNNPDFCLRMAENARKKAMETFDWEIVAGKYSDLYKKALNFQQDQINKTCIC